MVLSLKPETKIYWQSFLCLFVAGSFLWFFLDAYYFYLVSLTLIAIFLLPQKKIQICAASCLIAWSLLPTDWNLLSRISSNIFLGKIITMILFYSLLFAAIFFKRFLSPIKILVGYLFLISLLAWSELPNNSFSTALFSILLGLHISIFYIAMALVFFKKRTFSATKAILISAPFWSWSVRYLPLFDIKNEDGFLPLEREALLAQQKRGLKILFWGVCGKLVLDFLNWTLFASPSALQMINALPSLQLVSFYKGFGEALTSHSGIWQKWVAVVGHFLTVYINIAFIYAVPVGIARLAGFDLPAMFDQPWKAKSMAQFYGRFIFYYNQVLMEFFYIPSKELVKKYFSGRTKIAVALFLSVCFGGFIFHFIRDLPELIKLSFSQALLSYLKTLPYYFALGIFVGLSIILRSGKEASGVLRQTLSVFSYLVIWSLIYSIFVASFHSQTSLKDYLSYLSGMFGLT